jgi:hypothetical protein
MRLPWAQPPRGECCPTLRLKTLASWIWLPPHDVLQVSEIVDRAQKEEKMEAGLAKLEDAWGRVTFNFVPHKEGSDVALVKMVDEDFEVGQAWMDAQSAHRLGKPDRLTCRPDCLSDRGPGHMLCPSQPRRCWRTTRCWCKA